MDNDQHQPLPAVEQKFLFGMTVVCGDELFDCKVFAAGLADGTEFTRVVYDNHGEERIVDVDRWEEVGWIDMWYGEPSPWSALVGPSLDYHFAQINKDEQTQK